jgi:hypothetical protein
MEFIILAHFPLSIPSQGVVAISFLFCSRRRANLAFFSKIGCLPLTPISLSLAQNFFLGGYEQIHLSVITIFPLFKKHSGRCRLEESSVRQELQSGSQLLLEHGISSGDWK